MTEGTISLADGRLLGYREEGPPDAPAVLLLHATPGSRLAYPGDGERAGVRLIVAERPGYGLSDPKPGRSLLGWPGDVAQLADARGVQRFAVLGISGGGPAALACGYVLRERVGAVGLADTIGPYVDEPELSALLDEERRTVVELARLWHGELDEDHPPEVARRLASEIRGARLRSTRTGITSVTWAPRRRSSGRSRRLTL